MAIVLCDLQKERAIGTANTNGPCGNVCVEVDVRKRIEHIMSTPQSTTLVPCVPSPSCSFCGGTARVGPGAGPHWRSAVCQDCGHIWWLSQYTPEEQERRRLAGRDAAMRQLRPSVRQMTYLVQLGYSGPAPLTMADAATLIAGLVREVTP